MTTYETYKGYPPYIDGTAYGNYGYPSEMLHMAVVRDDPDAFFFYWERYFNDKSQIHGTYSLSLIEYAEKYGGKKVAKVLKAKQKKVKEAA